MVGVVLATLFVAVLAGIVYLRRERLGVQGAGLAALRTVALGVLFLALFNPGRLSRVTGGTPMVLLDASLSMGATGGQWQDALATVSLGRMTVETPWVRLGGKPAPA